MPDEPRIAMNANKLVQYLRKLPDDFTKADLIRFIEENGIKRLNFRYAGGDGRLKTLNFVVTSRAYLDRLLSAGERVDGSNLFPFIPATESDLYVIPRYRTAFVNPFSEMPTIELLCSYYTHDGKPFVSSPENVLRAAQESLKKSTGFALHAMGELEFYVISSKVSLYQIKAQKGYKESQPFSKMENLRFEAMQALAEVGANIKYGHNEVGTIIDDDRYIEQNEIELLPVPIEQAADEIVLARWVLRMVGHKYGVTVTFAPKVSIGHAGSGLHIHFKLMKDGKNVMVKGDRLSDAAKKAIAGILTMSPSLTAFGNVVPTSYMRLVSRQEAPTTIFWGDRNRLAMVRVPLIWVSAGGMAKHANPGEKDKAFDASDSATVEFRTPDGSADIYYLLAGIAVAARHGLETEDSLRLAEKLYVPHGVSPPQDAPAGRPKLPVSCWESAETLLWDRAIYERDGVFTPTVIDWFAKKLKAYDDKELRLFNKTTTEVKKMMDEYLHCA